jgi:Lon protease-like protein
MTTAIQDLPIFPLGTVLFPDQRLPLRIFEPRYVEMTKCSIRDDAPFGICLIRKGREVGAAAEPFAVGCSARIVDWAVPHPGLFQLVVQGESVFRILSRRVGEDQLVRASVELRAPADPQPVPPRFRGMSDLLERLQQRFRESGETAPVFLDDAHWLACRLAELLPLEPRFKQQLLETEAPLVALERIQQALKQMRSLP